jgi:Fuc2NAc and GlcNAc transferase
MRLTGTDQIFLACTVFLLALGIALLICREARYLGLVDVPNERSSHSRPTPRGGGLGIFVAVTLGVWFWAVSVHVVLVWRNMLIGAAAVAIIGLWDDVRSVSALLRFSVHVFAAVFLVLAFPIDLKIQLFSGLSIGGPPALLLSCVGVISVINMFNFMDGIDGLAASEAVFVTGGSGLTLLLLSGHPHAPVVVVCLLVSAASAGFLLANWPPARIFMGDVGSGFLGFAIAAVALWTLFEQLMSFWTWLILGGIFVTDATVTFFRRLLRGENVVSAHRRHGYQRLARLWSSHARVTLLATAINCLWLLPLAILATVKPLYAPAVAGIAIMPIGIAAWVFGAGLPE